MSSLTRSQSMVHERIVTKVVAVVLVLPLDRAPLWAIIYFFGAIKVRGEALCGGWEKDLECKLKF